MFAFLSFRQYPALPDYYKFILVTVLILMTLIEAIRLFLGYAGNLQEKVVHPLHNHANVSATITRPLMHFIYDVLQYICNTLQLKQRFTIEA